MQDLVVIEDATIRMMLSDNRFRQAFPCVNVAADRFKTAIARCSRCSRNGPQQQNRELRAVKSCLVALSAAKKVELKKLLNAKKVRVVAANANGAIIKYTF